MLEGELHNCVLTFVRVQATYTVVIGMVGQSLAPQSSPVLRVRGPPLGVAARWPSRYLARTWPALWMQTVGTAQIGRLDELPALKVCANHDIPDITVRGLCVSLRAATASFANRDLSRCPYLVYWHLHNHNLTLFARDDAAILTQALGLEFGWAVDCILPERQWLHLAQGDLDA